MKLHFAFGNPRKGKKKGKKKVALKKKKTKTKKASKKASRKKSSRRILKGKSMAKKKAKKAKKSYGKKRFKLGSSKKHKSSKRKSSKRKSKKNPMQFMARKNGKLVASRTKPDSSDYGPIAGEVGHLLKAYKASSPASAERSVIRKKLAAAQTKLKKMKEKITLADTTAQRLAAEGVDVKWHKLGGKVAKKKKSTKKKKSASKKKHVKKTHKKKTYKRKTSHKKHKTAKKHKKSTKRRKKRSMVTHTHAKSTRHIRKGSSAKFSSKKKKGSYKITSHFGKGKKRVKVSGRARVSGGLLKGFFKLNPFRSNPMAKLDKYTGMKMEESIALVIGGALVPVVNAGITKIPGVDKLAGLINSYAGPVMTGSIMQILAGMSINALEEHVIKGKASVQGYNVPKLAGEGLVAAGILGAAMSLAQQYLLPAVGLAGVSYTPNMHGVNYTPGMSGINYSPMSGLPQLSGPDFGGADYGGGGYQEDKRFSRADFGEAMDMDSDEEQSEDDIMSENLSGSMG